jgi:hypothetical protein
LYTLIDEWYVRDRTERVRMLLEAGVDVNVRVRCREYRSVLDRVKYDCVLDRSGVSVLERTRDSWYQSTLVYDKVMVCIVYRPLLYTD